MNPSTLLIAVGAFGGDLPADRVAGAIAAGVRERGRREEDAPEPDVCPLEDGPPADFDRRMRQARAVVVGAARLDRATLPGSPAFEIATRARQAGVPAFAVTARNELDAFDARMLDLQTILQAGTARELRAAGRRLAQMV